MEQSSILSKAYNCDCLEYMRKLPDNYFDLAIADPPYGIGASRPSKKAERARQPDGSILKVPVTDFTKKDWDDAIPTQEFFDELRRVSRNQIVWGANYFGLQGGMIVWDKVNGNSDQYDCEIAYQSFNKRTDLVHYMWNGMFQGKYCGRDIRQAAVQQGNKTLNEKRIHPTQKPVILYEWLLNNYAKKGDRIFDPMMGSQSSRIAAYRLGFDYVGCELDKEYFEKGCARFNSELMNNNKRVTNKIDIMDKNSFIDAEQQLLNFLRENFPGRDDIVHLTNPISFIDAEGKPYEVTGIELPTDDTETYSVQMQDARNREAGDYDYMELHSFGNFEKLLTGLQSNHEHKLSTSEMQVIEGHFARLRGALASIDVTNNLLAHELKGIVIDDNVHNVDHIRSYSRRLLFIINKENMELRRQQWNDLEKLSSGSLRQAVYAMAYSMSDAQIRSMTFGKILDDNKDKPYHIAIGEDNRPGGVEGEYHLQFKPDIMNVTFCEQEEVAKEFGGTMRVTKGQEWADFYHEADAVKFAEKIIGMNQERELQARFDAVKWENPQRKKVCMEKERHDDISKVTVIGSHGKVLNLIPSDDSVKNRIVETLKDRLVFHDAKSVDDVLDKINGSYEMKVWNRLNKELWEIAYRKNNTDISLKISPSDDLNKIKVIEHERRYYGQSDIDKPVGDFDLKELLDQQKETALLESYRSAGLGGNGTQFWPDKGALGIYQAFAFKNNNILVFKDADDSEGTFLTALSHEEQQRLIDAIGSFLDKHIASKELADAKARLVKVLESARADFGDTILIQPTTVSLAGIDTTIKAIFLAPDGKGGGEFRLAGEDYAVLAVGNGGHTEFGIDKILDNEDSVNALANAVHEAHVTQLKQGAKQAIHDRITNSWQRFFTSDQVNALNRYHQVVTPDIPAHQEFRYLLDEVAQESDVARKPEKWVNDTARELDGLAEGITRESGQGLKR